MLNQFQESLGHLLDKLVGWLDAIILLLPNIVLAAIVLAIFIFLSRYFKKAAEKALRKTTNNNTVTTVISNVAVAVFMILALFIVLNILNLSDAVTALLGTAGVVGLAVGLALQDPMVNLFSGVLMSVRDYYTIGDLVETNGYFGTIQKITLRSTVIAQPDGQVVLIPNRDILQNPLKNFSHPGKRRVEISCGVSYGDDLEKVKKVAVQSMKDSGMELSKEHPIEFYFNEFGDSSINFKLRFWKDIIKQGDYLAAQDQAIISLKKAFDKNDISIPFPIRTLDFGVPGGVSINEIYPPEMLKQPKNGSEHNGSMNNNPQKSETQNT
jgi:small conductance mechanosensitive channel